MENNIYNIPESFESEFYPFLFKVLDGYKLFKNDTSDIYANSSEVLNNYFKNNAFYLNFLRIILYHHIHAPAYYDVSSIYTKYHPEVISLIDKLEAKAYSIEDKKIFIKEIVNNLIGIDWNGLKDIYKDLKFYHYTTSDALSNIIKDHEIRFSNIALLKTNDKTEGAYLDKYCKKFCPNIFDSYNFTEKNTFSFSLSLQKDDAAQWDRYAKAGKGVCIVFSCNELFKYLIDPSFMKLAHGVFFLSPLKYSSFNNIEKRDYVADCALLNLQMSHKEIFNQLRFAFKDLSFESESEFRLYFCLDKNQTSINGLSNIRIDENYLHMTLTKEIFSSIIHTVILGPSFQEDNTLVDELNKNNICYIKSSCPLKERESIPNTSTSLESNH